MKRDFYRAVVTNVDDPETRGRVRFRCRELLNNDEEFPFWAEPCFPSTGANSSGFFFIPDVGTAILISIVEDHPEDQYHGETLMLSGGLPRWHCGLYNTPDSFPAEFKSNFPKRQGIKTAAGHLIMFDDTSGKQRILIRNGGKNGNGSGAYIALEPSGSVVVSTTGGQLLNMKSGSELSIHSGSNLISLSGDTVLIANSAGNVVTCDADGIGILSGGDVTVMGTNVEVQAAEAHVKSPTIKLGEDAALGVGRIGDAVSVTIPPSTVVTTPGSPTTPGALNLAPITLTGTITAGSTATFSN